MPRRGLGIFPRVTKVDQFESVFKSAARTPYDHKAVNVESVLVLTDLPPAEAEAWAERAKTPQLGGHGSEAVGLGAQWVHSTKGSRVGGALHGVAGKERHNGIRQLD